jgi:prophage DNA circulation protein
MQTWAQLLQECSYGGIKFSVIAVDDEFAQAVEVTEYDQRGGGTTRAHGARPSRHELQVVIAGEDYPEVLFDLVRVIRAGGVREFVHPVWGSMQAQAELGRVSHSTADGIDSATMRLTIVEHVDNPRFREDGTAPSRASAVRDAADAVVSAAGAYAAELAQDGAASLEQRDAPARATAAAQTSTQAATFLEDAGDVLPVVEIESTTNAALTAIDAALAAVSAATTTSEWALAAALRALATAIRVQATAIIEARPPLVDRTVEVAQPLVTWVLGQYARLGTMTAVELERRVNEVLDLNNLADPTLIPAGTRVRCYAA